MVKVTLELPEMPKNCKECLLHDWKSNGHTFSLMCKILHVNGLPHKRRDDCPLKLAEDREVEHAAMCCEGCPCANYCGGAIVEACMDEWNRRKLGKWD